MHVLSSFQRTGYLAVRALTFRPGRDHVPHQLYFLEGNLLILQSVHLSVNPFLVAASIFFEALSRGPHRMQAKLPPCPVGLRARGATWECELEEVFRLRADALRRNGHARSNQYTRPVRDCQHRQPPELSACQNPRNWLAGRTLKSPRRILDRSARSNDAKGKYIHRGPKRNPAKHFLPPRPQLTFNRYARRPISTTCSSPRRRNSL